MTLALGTETRSFHPNRPGERAFATDATGAVEVPRCANSKPFSQADDGSRPRDLRLGRGREQLLDVDPDRHRPQEGHGARRDRPLGVVILLARALQAVPLTRKIRDFRIPQSESTPIIGSLRRPAAAGNACIGSSVQMTVWRAGLGHTRIAAAQPHTLERADACAPLVDRILDHHREHSSDRVLRVAPQLEVPAVPVRGKVFLGVGRVDPSMTFDFVGRNSLSAEHVADGPLTDREVFGQRLRGEEWPTLHSGDPDNGHGASRLPSIRPWHGAPRGIESDPTMDISAAPVDEHPGVELYASWSMPIPAIYSAGSGEPPSAAPHFSDAATIAAPTTRRAVVTTLAAAHLRPASRASASPPRSERSRPRLTRTNARRQAEDPRGG